MKRIAASVLLFSFLGCNSNPGWRVGDKGVLDAEKSNIELSRVKKYGVPIFSSYVAYSEFCKSVNAGDSAGADSALDYARFLENGTTFLVLEVEPLGDGCEVRITSGKGDGIGGYVHANFFRKH